MASDERSQGLGKTAGPAGHGKATVNSNNTFDSIFTLLPSLDEL